MTLDVKYANNISSVGLHCGENAFYRKRGRPHADPVLKLQFRVNGIETEAAQLMILKWK